MQPATTSLEIFSSGAEVKHFREILLKFPDCQLCLVCTVGLKVEKELTEQNLVLAKPNGLFQWSLLLYS